METMHSKSFINVNFSKIKNIVIAGTVLVAATAGYMSWTNKNTQKLSVSSDLYQNLMHKLDAKDIAGAEEIALSLIKGFPKTPYAHLSGLVLAKNAIEAQDIPLAMERLKWVISVSDKVLLKPIAVSRLARLMVSEKQYEEALALIEQNEPYSESQRVLIENIRGDAYTALGNNEQAVAAYKYVADHLPLSAENTVLNYKLIDLGVKDGLESINPKSEQQHEQDSDTNEKS